jgi:hypothetical protein
MSERKVKDSRARCIPCNISKAITGRIVFLVLAVSFFAGSALAQTSVTVGVNSTYSNITSGNPIPNDYVGLSFETGSELSGNAGVTGSFFASSDTQVVTLFQQIGIKNLRMGGGTVDTASPADTDIDALFGFAPVARAKVIYSVPYDSPATKSADSTTVNYIWNDTSYSPWIHSFAIGNEEDATTTLSSYVSSSDWEGFQSYILTNGASSALFSAPDSGSYNGARLYTGTLCGISETSVSWARGFADCAHNSTLTSFSNATQHYYVGGGICNGTQCTTSAQAIPQMLSSNWVTGNTNTATEACGTATCVYYPYTWVYNNLLSGIVTDKEPYRLTELDDHVTGVVNASNAFSSALWALDVMQWWALHGAAGVNFHNNQWLSTDTIVPGNLTTFGTGTSFVCETGGVSAPCDDFVANPKGYGMKTFDLGGHGYTVGLSSGSNTVTSMPDSGSLDAYAVGSGQDLYVTLINKTDATNSDDTASVTISIGTSDAPFVTASVSSITLWNGDSGAPSDPSQLTAALGGGSILNTGAQWTGLWTGQSAMTSGTETISVPPATVMVLRFHAPSNYYGPIQMDQNGALEMFTTDSSGNVYHNWQKAADLNTEPNGASSNWNGWTENLSGATGTANPIGDMAVVKNLDNTLQIFIPTNGAGNTDVFYNRQVTPGGSWSVWADMGSTSAGLTHLQAGRNADGGLSVFGLDSSDNLWTSSENAPGVAWSSWTKLNTSGTTIQPGYVVGENITGRLEVFGVNSGGNVYHAWQTASNTWTSTWTSLSAPSGVTLTSWLQVARDVSGHLNVFAVGTNGTVYTTMQPSWPAWAALPTPSSAIQAGFVAGQNDTGRFELFGVGSDTNVYHMWITSAGAWTTSWANISGGPTGGFEPHLVVGNTNDGRLQVFGVCETSPYDVYSNYQQTAGGAWQSSWASFSSGGLIFYHGQP